MPETVEQEQKAAGKQRDSIAELQRVKDREVAEAKKAADAAQRELSDLRAQLEQAQGFIEMLKDRGELSDDEEVRMKRMATLENTLKQREERALGIEKKLTARHLHMVYGVPEEELLDYDDPRDMKVAALEWKFEHMSSPGSVDDAKATPPQSEQSKNEPHVAEQEPAPVQRDRAADLDLAIGGVSGGAESLEGLSPYQLIKLGYDRQKT